MNKILFSSTSSEYSTPKYLFDALNKEFHFTLDACASSRNTKCSCFYSLKDNALLSVWQGNVFMNPPYGRGLYDWVKKAYDSIRSTEANVVVALLPARTDTAWFHDFVRLAYEVRFIRGRLHFENTLYSAAYPNMIVVFKVNAHLYPKFSFVKYQKGI